MVVQRARLADPLELPAGVQATRVIGVEVALDGVAVQTGEPSDLGVADAPTLQPEDFHLLLHPRVRMVVPVVGNLGEVCVGEGEGAHGRSLPEWCCSRTKHYAETAPSKRLTLGHGEYN